MDGRQETIDGRPALVFERRLDHPVERVWRAVTDPEELALWFVAPVEWRPEVGSKFVSMEEPGEVTAVEEPRQFAWTWGDEDFSFRLEPDGRGCRLTFTHVFRDPELVANYAAGWEVHFDRLDSHLAGGHLTYEDASKRVPELHERYAEAFGVDPQPGREMIRRHLGVEPV
jgi:uncharacterized protein YndB with AHSA1/START domain